MYPTDFCDLLTDCVCLDSNVHVASSNVLKYVGETAFDVALGPFVTLAY